MLGSINGVHGATSSTNVGIGTPAPAYTLDVQGNGRFTQPITFASGQTFPGAGTVTSMGSGAGLTGGPIKTSGTLSVVTGGVTNAMLANPSLTVGAGTDLTGGGPVALGGSVTLNLDTTKVPQLAAANIFTGNQTVNGNVGATGVISGAGFLIGSDLFAFGSKANSNAFLGFSGNTTMTGGVNTAVGVGALLGNTTDSWNTAIGHAALLSNNTGGNNTAMGDTALRFNTTGSNNTATGAGALWSNQSSSDNTANGTYALYANTTGGGNTAIGSNALQNSTTGSLNTVIGYNALSYSTNTGSENTATGAGAMYKNSTGNQNTADGKEALWGNTAGYYNTASGYRALYSNTTAVYNTASGDSALYSNNTGNFNTASGTEALYSNTTGNLNTALGFAAGSPVDASAMTADNNTFLGANAVPSTGTLTNATAIGAYSVVGQSNSLVLGGTGYYAVNVGIGTIAPSHILTIAQGAGAAYADNWIPYSSRRFKTNIQTLHGALAAVQQLRGVSYDLKKSGKHEIGVIAEEVGAVVPEVVTWEKNGKDAVGVDYDRLTALLIEATKEQQALIQQQQQQIRAQQARADEQQSLLRAQQARNELQQAQIARLSSQVNAIQASLNANGQTVSKLRRAKARTTRLRE